ncbi:hypothetical protein JTE90_006654 [Oedothorax gibbosus]|uniref:Uncharacterized protein n=1 Tax=Oedothorax gibbosus TaxID=931172 RepID=A0AAV6TRB0_9ARAC|nr:hypothetical protein JTE90_006654 [Oedothorax gibbosus]
MILRFSSSFEDKVIVPLRNDEVYTRECVVVKEIWKINWKFFCVRKQTQFQSASRLEIGECFSIVQERA